MRKATMNGMIERRGMRILGAASLALTFAAFGCTTTRYGEPTSVSPSYGPVNHGTTPGSSSGTEEGVSPMASSYTGVSRIDTDALATLAAEQGFRGRVLGTVNPGGIQTGVPLQPTGGQFVSPAMITNPQSTVNSSISSEPNPVISSGTADVGVSMGASATTGRTTGTTMGTSATTAGTTGAVATTGTLTTSTGAGVGVTGRALAATSKTTTARTTSTTAAKTARTSSTKNTTNVAMTAGVSPIRIEAGTKGQVTVTNATAVPSAKAASTKP